MSLVLSTQCMSLVLSARHTCQLLESWSRDTWDMMWFRLWLRSDRRSLRGRSPRFSRSRGSGGMLPRKNFENRDCQIPILVNDSTQSDLQYGTNAYWTTLTNARQNRLIRSSKRALRAVINAPTTTPTKTILSLLNLSPPWNTSETQTACSHFPMHTQQGKLSPLCAVPSSITHSQHTTHHQSTNIHLTYYSTS